MKSFQTAKNVRREARSRTGRFRGGKLNPVMAVAIRGNEGGVLSQNLTLELGPIPGRLITEITAEMVSVFVPVQAIDAIKDPNAAYAGMTEVIREKLLSGNPLFGLENEGEISKRCKVNPRSIGGQKRVNEMVRLAHNAAVNFLRQRKYVNATLLPHTNAAVTPAILGQTVLERLNGVLDPDDRINGSVQLSIPNVNLPVLGLGLRSGSPGGEAVRGIRQTDGSTVFEPSVDVDSNNANVKNIVMRTTGTAPNTYPAVVAQLNGVMAGNLSLHDIYNAEKRDQLTRTMREIMDQNPEYGQEMILRWAHGLSVDSGKVPWVLAEETRVFGKNIVPAMDSAGVLNDTMRSDMALKMEFTVPVPRTELGGIIITFAVIKPDETLSDQPHPFLSDVWGLDNFVADELAIDPVPVTIRELDSECTSGQESTVAMYTGLNALKQTYVDYGLSRQLNPTTVQAKTAIWQLKIPLSVTPDTILYPADISHYPFADNGDGTATPSEVCTYTITSAATIQTPLTFGPTPVEELAVIETEDLFEEN
jgi:hypothetical protein